MCYNRVFLVEVALLNILVWFVRFDNLVRNGKIIRGQTPERLEIALAVRQIRTCDVDGAENATQHVLSFDGIFTSLDLCEKDEKTLEQTLGKYLDAGAEISSREAMKLVQSNGGEELDPAVIRAWAETKGIKIGVKGRIPAEVTAQYVAEKKAAEAAS